MCDEKNDCCCENEPKHKAKKGCDQSAPLKKKEIKKSSCGDKKEKKQPCCCEDDLPKK